MSWHRHDFGRAILQVRQDRSVSLRKAGRQSGVYFTTFGRIEHGQIETSIEKIVAIAEWANLSLDYFRKNDAALGITGATIHEHDWVDSILGDGQVCQVFDCGIFQLGITEDK